VNTKSFFRSLTWSISLLLSVV